MSCIAGQTKASNFGVNRCSTSNSVVSLLKEKGSSPFPHHKAAPLLVKGARCAVWLIVKPPCQATNDITAAIARRGQRSFAGNGKHQCRLTILYHLVGMPNHIDPAGTGGSDGITWSRHLQEVRQHHCRCMVEPIQVERRWDLLRIKRLCSIVRCQ